VLCVLAGSDNGLAVFLVVACFPPGEPSSTGASWG